MKVLVDRCVWSLSLRRRKGTAGLSAKELHLVTALSEAIRDGRVVMVGAVRQELLSGIGDAKQFERLRGILEAFPNEPMTTAIHVEAARLDNLCRAKGVQCVKSTCCCARRRCTMGGRFLPAIRGFCGVSRSSKTRARTDASCGSSSTPTQAELGWGTGFVG